MIITDILIHSDFKGFFPDADFYVTAGFIKEFPVDFPHSTEQVHKHRHLDFLKQFKNKKKSEESKPAAELATYKLLHITLLHAVFVYRHMACMLLCI